MLLSIGIAIFVALLAWQGFGPVAATLMAAGWGLLLIAAFHLLPLALDAAAIVVLFGRDHVHGSMRDALLARWAGESVNSLLPAGQIGGPVMMVRHLTQRSVSLREAAAAITVSTTMQALAQIVFALFGLALFGAYTARNTLTDLRIPMIVATALLTFSIAAFYWAQQWGLFGRLLRMASKAFGRRDWSALTTHADALDAAISALYREHRKVAATFALSFVGWLAGTGEVWLALRFLAHPVSWLDALLLESAGQAIRGAAFAIPASLGVQEAGYLLLAPFVGLPPEAALALSLAKRARELLLGVPGIVYLHWSERNRLRRRTPEIPVTD
jgi:putative membrane protein